MRFRLGRWSAGVALVTGCWLLGAEAGAEGHSRHSASQRTHRGERALAPIVSASWLAEHRTADGIVVIDVRPADAYASGHVPGSLNVPFVVPVSAWITLRDDILLEVPDAAAIFETLGGLGLSSDSKVVVVTAPNPGEPAAYGYSAATRAADTLLYAGIRNVAILDGGFAAWQRAGWK